MVTARGMMVVMGREDEAGVGDARMVGRRERKGRREMGGSILLEGAERGESRRLGFLRAL